MSELTLKDISSVLYSCSITHYQDLVLESVCQRTLFGAVYFLIHKPTSKRKYVVKVSDVTKRSRGVSEDPLREAAILRYLNDTTYYPRFYGIYSIKQKYTISVQEYAGIELFRIFDRRRKSFTEKDALLLFREMVLAVQDMHNKSVAHLDISLENVCVDPDTNRVRLIDMGVSLLHPLHPEYRKNTKIRTSNFWLEKDPLKPDCDCRACTPKLPTTKPNPSLRFRMAPVCMRYSPPGKILYMAPELYSRDVWDAYQADAFSLGVCLYAMLGYSHPFDTPNDSKYNRLIGDDAISTLTSLLHISPTCADLIASLLKPQEERLPIHKILSHACFSI